MSMRIGRVVAIPLLLSMMACSADKAGNQNESNSPGTGSAAPGSVPGSTLGSSWADAGKMPDLFSATWVNLSSFVEDDATLNVPYTEQAQKYVDAYKHKRDIPYAQEGCRSPGLPLAMRLGGELKFTYTPGLISIYMQSVGDTRFIKMNQKQGKTSPKFYGNSVGHWEGDTLVVETEDFLNEITFQYGVGKPLPPEETVGTAGNPGAGVVLGGAPLPGGAPPAGLAPPRSLQASLSAAIWGPHGEGMRMVERMRLVNPETMEHKLTIYDDTVWTKPYVMSTRNYKRIRKGINDMGPFNGEPEEYVCTVSITNFDPETNTYVDKDPEEMVEYLNKQQGR